jgi:hypothetical protein
VARFPISRSARPTWPSSSSWSHASGHAAAFAVITDPLASLAPGDYLRATAGTGPTASSSAYRLIIDVLKDQFATAGTFSSLAVSAMRVMDDTNRLLAQRGLLPPFTSPNAMPFTAAQASLVTSASSPGLLMQCVTGSMCRWAG